MGREQGKLTKETCEGVFPLVEVEEGRVMVEGVVCRQVKSLLHAEHAVAGLSGRWGSEATISCSAGRAFVWLGRVQTAG